MLIIIKYVLEMKLNIQILGGLSPVLVDIGRNLTKLLKLAKIKLIVSLIIQKLFINTNPHILFNPKYRFELVVI